MKKAITTNQQKMGQLGNSKMFIEESVVLNA
jgi:hypothetical protein